jgi:hypothetical protein
MTLRAQVRAVGAWFALLTIGTVCGWASWTYVRLLWALLERLR